MRRLRFAAPLVSMLCLLALASPAWAVFPTTAILDGCNRANENPILGPTGTEWTTTFFVATQPIRILSSACQDNPGARSESYWSAASFGPNGEVFATVISPVGTLGEDAYLAYRVGSPGATMTGYLADFANNGSAGSTSLNLYSVVAGSATPIITGFAMTLTINDVIGVGYVGDVHTIYQNGAAIVNVTDSTSGRATGAGFIGLGINNPTTNTASFQNFGGGTTGTPPPSTTRHRAIQSRRGGCLRWSAVPASGITWCAVPARYIIRPIEAR